MSIMFNINITFFYSADHGLYRYSPMCLLQIHQKHIDLHPYLGQSAEGICIYGW
jgi:hypothetical protein